ncbi:MAG: hypothetical protein IKN47_01495, partial [Lachnospiraceae bacterium]|nr:hypothetical protein [Lachnospiraceae bacterium]
ELTSILEDEYENYHFEEDINGNDIVFPYKISKGRATSRNAIKLLGFMGYDSNIIKKANDMVSLMENDLKPDRFNKINQ